VSKDDKITGELIELDVKSRKQKPLAAAITNQRLCLELSPDNKAILFTAIVAGKPGEKLVLPEDPFPSVKLYEWKAGEQGSRVFNDKAQFARYSPSGKHVLLAEHPVLQSAQITVADATGKETATVATDGVLNHGGDLTLPGWLDDNTIYYFADRSVYGSGGNSFSLMTVAADGTKKKNAQPALDKAVLQLAKDMPTSVDDAKGGGDANAEPKDAKGGEPREGRGVAHPRAGEGLPFWVWPAVIVAVLGVAVLLVVGVGGVLLLRRGKKA